MDRSAQRIPRPTTPPPAKPFPFQRPHCYKIISTRAQTGHEWQAQSPTVEEVTTELATRWVRFDPATAM